MRGGIIKRLNLVVYGNRYNPCFARDISANHQYDTKLTQSVGEAQSYGSQVASNRQRQRDREKGIHARGAQRPGCLKFAVAQRLERGNQRLHCKWQAIQT